MNTSLIKQMTRSQRLAIGFIVPPLIAVFLFVLNEPKSMSSDGFIYFAIFFSFIFAGVQSLAYSYLMEFLVNPYLKNNLLVILISALIGSLSGFIAIDWMEVSPSFRGIIDFTSKGAITGLIVGALLRWSYIKASKEEPAKQSSE